MHHASHDITLMALYASLIAIATPPSEEPRPTVEVNCNNKRHRNRPESTKGGETADQGEGGGEVGTKPCNKVNKGSKRTRALMKEGNMKLFVL